MCAMYEPHHRALQRVKLGDALEIRNRQLLGLDFVNWQQRQSRGWPWSGNSVQARVLQSTDHMLH